MTDLKIFGEHDARTVEQKEERAVELLGHVDRLF